MHFLLLFYFLFFWNPFLFHFVYIFLIIHHPQTPIPKNHFIVTEESKPFHVDWTGPAQLVNEIDRDKFEVFNMFNFGMVKNKPSSTGLTLIRKK